jgi:hypothetical protein
LKQPHQIRSIIRNVIDQQRILVRPNRSRYEVYEFQPHVKDALKNLLIGYDVIDFSKTISWSEAISVRHQPDLVIISKNRRHWTIVEVELHTHEVGYSYSSEYSRPHIYHQVETFADGDYHMGHIEKIAAILGEDISNLESLLKVTPDVLVIGDNSDVMYGPKHNNWNRLLEIGDNVHLAFLEVFEDPDNPTETCSYFQGWLPPEDTTFRQKLRHSGANWVDSLSSFKEELINCPDGHLMIEVNGLQTVWRHIKKWNILQSLDVKSSDYLNKNGQGAVFELSHTIRGYSLEMKK